MITFIIILSILIFLILIGLAIYFIIRKKGHKHKKLIFHPANDRAGYKGEKLVIKRLNSLVNNDEYLLTNLLVPSKKHYKTEIDDILISHRGIYVIEVKNWIGAIIGNDDDEEWQQQYKDKNRPNRVKENPVKQNGKHCGVVSYRLKDKYPIQNIVIFPSIENKRYLNSVHTFELKEFPLWYVHQPVTLTTKQIEKIYRKLKRYIASDKALEKHRQKMIKKYND